MPDTPNQLQFDDPVVMWRMRRAGAQVSHAVITPRPDGAIVMWFINGRLLGYRHFEDWTGAIRWSDQLRAQSWAAGWRMAPEYDDAPARRTTS